MEPLRCSSCDKPKAELLPRESHLIKGMKLFMCRTCLDAKLEPRWIIIMAGRSNGPDFVREYVIKNRYIGKPITAAELIK
jgi:hypothetical protein